ncbi:MAG: VWA domain-containing protein [Bacteroidota bacterium]
MKKQLIYFLLVIIFGSLGCIPSLQGQIQGPKKSAILLKHKDRIRTKRMDILNSSYRETNLSITPDGRYLFFMSMRGGREWSRRYMTFKGDSVYDGDIWFTEKVAGNWVRPRCMPLGVNTSFGEDEPNVSADGRRVYFQSWNPFINISGGPYYRAERSGSRWGEPVGLGGGITQFFRIFHATDGMSISPKEDIFLVAAGMDSYEAPMDIYISRKTEFGWTYCRRLGISTYGNERSVFIAGDGKTIYFSSDGYEGMGGLDIYKTTLKPDGTIGEVINLGAPFNTAGDDFGFILTQDGSEAYFVRDGDIYFADLTEADDRMKPAVEKAQIVLKGIVLDENTSRGLSADIILMDARSKRVLRKIQSGPNGRYQLTLPNSNRVYDQIVIKRGYDRNKRRLTVSKSYQNETYQSDFILNKTAVVEEQPPVAVTPPPKEKPKPEIAVIEKKETPISPPPRQLETPTPLPVEDPYSFVGVAQNNLVLLLDVSASMRKPEKLPLLKESLSKLLTHLRAGDLISVVVYSGEAKIVLDGISAGRKKSILNAIDQIRSGGGTKGKTALRKAYKVAEENYIASGNNRIILATDGYFNVPPLYTIANKYLASGIKLSVFSFGKIPQDRKDELKLLARYGEGNYAQIERENVDGALLKEAKAVRSQ